ncbi:hypothetical protein Ctob_004673 [Chrysochromulina tobinii]|uniref:Uncharacterized protein n=1 Tax=Chrysochromulina tobinii TaxID=1460289 RepID=A0A0M0JZN9_9EUKA|nr:hypothetical protein Ctob_004673 [Chrysochromulina tobinii]|eukprot:KOO32019.1 hypothetical protein Ctob_004673 [Chrysochromulina sp. CCMP291]
MERENPEAMLEPEELALVQAGARALRCDVCLAASKGSKPEERGGSTMQYNELVIKHVVISRACKHVILEPDADIDDHDGAVDRPDLAQTIYVHSAETAEQIAARYCRPFCGARAGSKEEL